MLPVFGLRTLACSGEDGTSGIGDWGYRLEVPRLRFDQYDVRFAQESKVRFAD
ncbi:hypothetical protein RBB77_17840 [Tunturibacter psychrotolerans]|uniref:Uncharacterized protein n=1 Tax=Tunturiibacter psychrotolerans TaxID=3069686 RepID=A0AAU7ZM35_9BACT